MELTTRTKVIISVVALATSFATGRFLTPEKIVTKTETITVEKKVDDTKTNIVVKQDKHYKKTTTDKIDPNGTRVVTTTTTLDTGTDKDTKTDSKENLNLDQDTKSSKEVTNSSSKTTILGTLGLNPFSGSSTPAYGISVSRPVLGPITVGVSGTSAGTATMGIGLTF